MSIFDENQNSPGEPAPEHTEIPEPVVATAPSEPIPGDPLSYIASGTVPPAAPRPVYPEDLQISWGWVHFIVFILYAVGSILFIQGTLAIYFLPKQKLSQAQIEQYLMSKPQFTIGSMLIWYAAIFFFLFITVSFLHHQPF